MRATMRTWTSSCPELMWAQLENLSVWFYRGQMVAFGNAAGSERWICTQWGEDMGSRQARELDRLSEHGLHPTYDPVYFGAKWTEKVEKNLRDILTNQRELAMPGGSPMTRVPSFEVAVNGDHAVKAVARIETSLDQGRTWLSAEVSEHVKLDDWRDESVTAGAESAKKKLASKLATMGFTVPQRTMEAARVNI